MKLYRPFPRSTVSQNFGANANALYASQGLKGHTSTDFVVPCGTPLPNCAEGLCYSVLNKDNPDLSKYRAAYFLVESDKDLFEVSYGHLGEIHCEPGKTYPVGAIIGTTSNTGDVYSYGEKVTKHRPGCPGGHLHGPQIRPVRRVTKRTKGKRYLETGTGVLKQAGAYYEVLDQDNGYAGCVDPEPFFVGELPKAKPAPVTFKRDLDLRKSGEDVRELQRYLNRQGFLVTKSGPGAPGLETDYFGTLTRAAVAQFQRANGIMPTAGYFGPKTRAVINSRILASAQGGEPTNPMEKISIAGTGTYVLLISLVLNLAGIEPEPGSIEALVNGTVAATGLILMILGQLKRADLKWGLLRKD